MYQVFQRYVVIVSYGYCKSRSGTCCKCFRDMTQAFVQNILSIPDICRKRFDLDAAYVSHILQQYVSNVLSILVLCCSKCFHVASCKCFISMLHMFHIYVASVCYRCFISVLDIHYIQVFHVACGSGCSESHGCGE
jgi:hypothetical protein